MVRMLLSVAHGGSQFFQNIPYFEASNKQYISAPECCNILVSNNANPDKIPLW